MQNFKTLSTSRLAMLIGGVVLGLGLAWPLMGTAQDKSDTLKDSHQHSQHKQPSGNPDLAGQIAELHAKVAKLEAALNRDKNDPQSDTPDKGGAQDKAGGDAPNDRASAKFQYCLECHRTRPTGPLPSSHLEGAGGSGKGAKPDGMAGMGDKKPAGGMGMGMMGGKGMGMMGGKGMGKDMGAMDSGKAEMGGMEDMDMDEMKGMDAMGGGTAGNGSGASPPSVEMRMMDRMMSMMEKMMANGSMQHSQGMPAEGGMRAMGGSAAPQSAETRMMNKMDKMMGLMEKMIVSGSMQHSQGMSAVGGKGAMGGGRAPQSVETRMMNRMDKMMGLMEKMMEGDSMQSGQGMPAGGMPDM